MEEVINHIDLNIDKSNWKPVKFGDVVTEPKETCKDIVAEGIEHVVGLEHIDSGDIHLRKSATIEESTTFTKKFRKGDVLFGRRRAYLKKAAQAEFDGICSGDITVFRAKKELLPELLPFIVHNEKFFDYAIKHSAGGLSPRVKFKDLANYEFLLPPKSEQVRLAELLWAMDEVIERESTLKENAKNLRDSIFQKDWQIERKEAHCTVQKLLLSGPTNGYSPKSNIQGKGTKTVSIGAIKEGLFDPLGNIKFAEVDPTVLSKYNIERKDVFVVRGNGNKKLCGKAGIAEQNHPDMFYPDLLVRLRFDSQKILPNFAAYQWNHPITHSKLLRSAKSTNGIWKINGEDIKRHSLAVPSLSVQKKIMSKMDKLNLIIDQIFQKLGSSKTLQKSLINQIF